MDFNNKILYSKPYYKLAHTKSFETIGMYYKFVNWVSGEFDLYLQDEFSGLKIFYPNGWIDIRCVSRIKNDLNIEIAVVNKSKKVCEKLIIQMVSLYKHFIWVCGYPKMSVK